MDFSTFSPALVLVTVVSLALAPFVAVMVTSFTKIVVVLSLLRNALGLQQVPLVFIAPRTAPQQSQWFSQGEPDWERLPLILSEQGLARKRCDQWRWAPMRWCRPTCSPVIARDPPAQPWLTAARRASTRSASSDLPNFFFRKPNMKRSGQRGRFDPRRISGRDVWVGASRPTDHGRVSPITLRCGSPAGLRSAQRVSRSAADSNRCRTTPCFVTPLPAA